MNDHDSQSEKPKLFGERLVEAGIIEASQLDMALKKQEETGELLGTTLLKLGFVDEESVILFYLAQQFGVELAQLRQANIPPDTITRLPAKFVTFYKVIPVHYADGTLTVASHHPLDVHIMDGINLATTDKIKMVFAGEKDINEAIRKYYGVGAETLDQMMGTRQLVMEDVSSDNLEELDSEASISKFINQILLEAYKDRATDIHIEPFEQELKVRYRIDGILYDAQVPANSWHFKDSIVSRIKIMSNLNIAEKRLPQDGRCKVKIGSADLDMRVSILPTQFGESVVIRLLTSTKLYSLADLGLSPGELSQLDHLIKKPHGIIFVTGPTGSGKTTTLYSCLAQVNKADRKIITIEDPIEYQLNGVTQIQINPAIGLTFAAGLRSMLRHDPDIMMVGEVRDLETAEIAIQIALTGHLVFSTLHTNDAASGATRLIDMGVEPYLVSSAVECFIAQRLVRMLCPKCKTQTKMTAEIATDFGFDYEKVKDHVLHEPKGCESCNMTGFFGRQAIYEFLPVDDMIKDMIVERASSSQIKHKAMSMGMKTLLQHGWEKVTAGLTTPSEIIRVTKEEMAET